jgi:hypothetical protein
METKVFYVIKSREVENEKGFKDVGITIDKIVLSTESEDFKMYWKLSKEKNIEYVWEGYIDDFLESLSIDMEKEMDKSRELENSWIWDYLLLWERQYEMLKKSIGQEIVEREFKVVDERQHRFGLKRIKEERV